MQSDDGKRDSEGITAALFYVAFGNRRVWEEGKGKGGKEEEGRISKWWQLGGLVGLSGQHHSFLCEPRGEGKKKPQEKKIRVGGLWLGGALGGDPAAEWRSEVGFWWALELVDWADASTKWPRGGDPDGAQKTPCFSRPHHLRDE